MINCLECRSTLTADPQSASVRTHLGTCASCRAWAEPWLQQERLIVSALDVATPEGLLDQLLLRQHERAPRPRPWFAAAAAAAFVLIGALVWAISAAPSTSWLEVVVAHVTVERSTLTLGTEVPEATLVAALKTRGLSLHGSLGAVRYVDECELPGGNGVHVVVETAEAGRYSFIVLPDGVRPPTGSSTHEGLFAQLVRVHDRTIGVVAQRPEQLRAAVTRLLGELGS